MSDQLSIAAIIISVIVGIPALVFAILSHRDNKRIREELDGSLGTPAVQIYWGNPAKDDILPCRVTAMFNRVRAVRLKVQKEERTVDELARGVGKDLEFRTFP